MHACMPVAMTPSPGSRGWADQSERWNRGNGSLTFDQQRLDRCECRSNKPVGNAFALFHHPYKTVLRHASHSATAVLTWANSHASSLHRLASAGTAIPSRLGRCTAYHGGLSGAAVGASLTAWLGLTRRAKWRRRQSKPRQSTWSVTTSCKQSAVLSSAGSVVWIGCAIVQRADGQRMGHAKIRIPCRCQLYTE